MGSHAILSPSASGRWIRCPASIRMSRDLPTESESAYALEGTHFHTLCEIEASREFLGLPEDEYRQRWLEWALETEDEWRDDQLMYVKQWIELLRELLADEPDATLMLEKRVDTGVPGCWGTADAVIIYPDRLHVIDIKYGKGLKVSALENSQLRLYGVGSLSLVPDLLTIHDVTTTIWQPRMDNYSSETLTRRELTRWRDNVIPIARLALGEDAPFGPSEDACRYCPAAGICAVRTKFMLDQDFGNPEFLDGDGLADAYSRTSALKKWITDIEDAALKQAYENAGSVPGFKVVRSGGRRQITDKDKAINALIEAGYDESDVSRVSPATLGDLDRLVGAEKLQQVLGDLLITSEGRLSLAPESDSRPPADAVHSAQDDFAEID